MNNLTIWLKGKGLSENSIQRLQETLALIRQWAEESQLDFDNLNYGEVTTYVQYLQERNLKPQTINNRLISLTHYFDFLMQMGDRETNPIRYLRVKSVVKPIKKILSKQELRELFEKFPSQNHRNLRDKVMLGLFIFQGVNTGTLRALKIQDVHLEKGSVYLPSLKRSNARNLPLNPAQILSLNQYLVDVRPFLEGNSEPLILGNMSNLLTLLLAKLQTINPNVLFIRQLRTSVIVDWLREYNLREVQYFAGHRNITTTEEYLMQDVGKLKKTLGDFHPLR